MQRVKKNIFDLKFLSFVTGITIFLLTGIILLPLFRDQTINFQSKKIIAYDDRLEPLSTGNSEILSISNDSTGLKFSYILYPGFTYPYVGIVIPLKKDSGNFFDCSHFDKLKIRIVSKQLSDCKLYLKVFDAKVSKFDDPLTERYLKKDLILDTVPVTISIPFNQFLTPEWWYQKNNITLKDVAPLDLSKVTALQIESGSTAKTGIIDTIMISQISLSKNPNIYAVALLVIFSVLTSVFIFFRYLQPSLRKNPIIITYEKKEIGNYRDIDAQRISAYLAEHFAEPELSIVTMGESLGITQKKVAKVMNDVFKMSFKQYLTSIRIHEAKRLLQATDRLVIDIALAVGFNNISHFNRVFKSSTQISPLEFRKRNNTAKS